MSEKSITCPKCGKISYNENDIKNRYCGQCHKFHVTVRNLDFERVMYEVLEKFVSMNAQWAFEKIIRMKGLPSQLSMVTEETAELTVAINHHKRGREGSKEEVIEELIDTMMMSAELVYILTEKFGIDGLELLKMLDKKWEVFNDSMEEQNEDKSGSDK